MIDIRQTDHYGRYLKKIGWEVERSAEVNYFIKKIPLLGSILKIQRPAEIRIDKIRQLAHKHRVFEVIVEPRGEMDREFLVSLGFKLGKSPFLPTKTLLLDTTKPGTRLIKEMKKDARYAVKKTRDLKIKKVDDLEEFRKAWKGAVGLRRYVPPLKNLIALKNTFADRSLFLLSPEFSSGAIFLFGDKIGYYWQAFTGAEGRKRLLQYRIVWEGILWAKGKGARLFDFEGVFDERFPNKDWKGFSHFKKSFGGNEISYPGAYVKSLLLSRL